MILVGLFSASAQADIAINAGGRAYTSSDGTYYLADTYYSGGYQWNDSTAISSTTDDELYQTQRFGLKNPFSYNIPIANGSYEVTFRFAELYYEDTGEQVFDIIMEETEVISDLDILSYVSQYSAYDKTVPVYVNDGTLNITFSPNPESQDVIVSAIEVVEVSSSIDVSLSAEPQTINAGSSSVLTWESTNANTVQIDQGIGTVTPVAGGSRTVTPVVTTTYTATATGSGGTVTDSFTITVNHVPTVNITASPNPIVSDLESTMLTWETTHANIGVSIDNGIGYVVQNGSITMSPLVTTTYTITAEGDGGTVTDSVEVVVNELPTVSISALPVNIITGDPVTLFWTISNASSAEINPGSIPATPIDEGSVEVSPTVTTVYTISAQNQYGTTTDSVEVVVGQMPTVGITASADTIKKGDPVTLSWTTTNADSALINPGSLSAAPVDAGSVNVSPEVTTTYTITATGGAGQVQDQVTVTVTESTPVPTVNIYASPENIFSGGASTLTWTTAYAYSGMINPGSRPANPINAGSIEVSPSVTTTYTLSVQGNGGTASDTVTVNVTSSSDIKLETGVVENVSGSSWTTVNLSHSYNSMVVVATPNYNGSTDPCVTRIRNASGSSFDVRLGAAGGSNPYGLDVYYMVVEEGVYTRNQDGATMEAVKFTSTLTDQNNSWVGQARTYQNTYSSPVVLGQVMTYNDPDFSYFWSRGSSSGRPPSNSTLYVGKAVGEDTDANRSNETIGYVVIEAGSGTIEGIDYTAYLGTDTVRGIDNSSAGYTYSISGISYPKAAVLSAAGMDGGNGGWPVLFGSDPVAANAIDLVFDEDVVVDTERSHTTEQVAYVVFGGSSAHGVTADIFASPSVITAGWSSNLTWTTANATSVVLDDGRNTTSVSGAGSMSTGVLSETTTFTIIAQGPGGNATDSVTVSVAPSDLPAVNISASPSSISSGESTTLTWTSTNASSAQLYDGGNTYTVPTDVVASVESPSITTTYTVTVYGDNSSSASDSVTVTVNQPGEPTVSISASDTAIVQGENTTLTWSSGNADAITMTPDIGYPGYAGNAVPPVGSYTVQPGVTTTYSINATGSGSSASDTVTVTVHNLPTVGLSVSPDTIAPGQTSVLSWTSVDADNIAITPDIGVVSGPNGSVETGIINATTEFTITAINSYGTATNNATVYVSTPPTVAIIASPNPVVAGNSTTLSWTSSNSATCTIDHAIGSVGTSGNLNVTPLSATTYTITAQGPGGTATDTVTVGVASLPPTVELDAEQRYILEGGATTISWISKNAVSGSIEDVEGDVSGEFSQRDVYEIPASELALGAMNVNPAVTTSYIITVTNNSGGTAYDSVKVEVANNPPKVQISANPNPITSGDHATLTWNTDYSTEVTLDDGTGPVSVNPSGSMMIDPLRTTTYTIKATSEYGEKTDSVKVTVTDALSVNIWATPNPIKAGGNAELVWTSNNATSATIDNGIGGVAVEGSYPISPSETTVYTITVSDGTNTVSDSIRVTARDPVPLAKIAAGPMNIANGEGTTITWMTQEADTVSVTGLGTVQRSGARFVHPNSTTTYTVTATNEHGSVTDSVTVGVNENVPVIDLYVDPMAENPIHAGDLTRIVWEGQNVGNADITMDDGTSTSYICQDCAMKMGNVTVAPTVTTTYTVEAESNSGNKNSDIVTIVVEEPPIIDSFAAIPPAITFGEFSTLAWQVFGADDVFIDNGIGSVGSEGNAVVQPLAIIHPLVTTTYTIIAINEFGTSVDTTTVSVAHMPTVSITAEPATIIEGDSTTLSWTSTYAETAVMDSEIGEVAVNGELPVSPDETITYTITVTGPGGISSASVEVTVLPLPEVTISAEPEEIIQGESANLLWTSLHADTVSIDCGVGEVELQGSVVVSPRMTTTYTITATRDYEVYGGITTVSAEATVTIAVNPLPTVTLSANPEEITEGESSTLSWSTTDADDISIDNGVGTGFAANGTVDVSPMVTTTYTIDVANAYGTDSATTTVTVHPVPTVDISADNTTIAHGGSTNLNWTSQNAQSASIDQNIGTVAVNGSTSVSPTVTTTYTITASSQYGYDTDSVTVNVTNLPTVEIVASPETITAGESVTISWSAVNADPNQVSINQFGSVATEGSRVVTPNSNTTYTITASNAYGSDTMSVTVTVNDMPSVSISASPSSVSEGSSSTLSWSSSNATTVQIDQGIGTVSGSGSRSVSPTVTTTYTISATNQYGTVTDSTTISVSNKPSVSIEAFPITINLGESTTLTWNSVDADTITIDNGIGSQAAQGSYVATPASVGTCTYTITATNSFGTVTDSVDVTVNALPVIDSFTVDDSFINEGDSTTLRWNTSSADSAEIDQGIGGVSVDGSRSISPTVTTTYKLTATNTHGSVDASLTVDVGNQPSATITATPTVINSGESTQIEWSTVDATSISITPDIGVSSSQVNGTRTVSPSSTTTYTITASNSNGSVSESVTVTVNDVPVINSFYAVPTSIIEGENTTLNWSSSDATSASIDQGIGTVSTNGSRSVSPSITTTYTLTVTNTHGSDTESLTVTVGNFPSVTITATPDEISQGSNTTLNWSTVDATSISFTPDIGVSSSQVNGTQSVSPSSTTTYTITATNSNGSVSESVTVTVNDVPVINSFSADETSIVEGQSTTLNWSSSNATSASIDQGVGSVNTSGTRSVSPSITTTYTLTVTSTYGSDSESLTITVDNLPSVMITATPEEISEGSNTTLSWSTVDATSISFTPDIGVSSSQVNGTQSVSPSSTTTYTITASNSNGSVSESVTVTVNNVPVINSFYAVPTSIVEGENTTLNWSSSNATSASIDQGVGTVNTNGTRSVSPSITTTYTLTATNTHGSVSQSLTVTVGNLPSVTITATPEEICEGSNTILSWSTVDATSISFTPDIGVSSSQVNGTQSLSPSSTTIYTITATNGNGSVSESVTVTVNAVPHINSFYADDTSIINGESTNLNWTTSNASAVYILPDFGRVSSNGYIGASPTVTTTYTINAVNTYGIDKDSLTITVNNPPTVSMNASPNTINSGSSSTLEWTSTGTEQMLTIDNGIGYVSTPSGTYDVSPTVTTTYTITATNQYGSNTDTATVTVTDLPDPPTVDLNASPATIDIGDSSTLSWTSTNVTMMLTMDNGIGYVSTPSGTLDVSPNVTTTYTISATNDSGTDTDSVTITVNSQPDPPPTVDISTTTPTINEGDYAVLNWSSSNAMTLFIDNGVGVVSISGSENVWPSVTTVYTITANNDQGFATDSVTIVVGNMPSVSLNANPSSISEGSSSTLSWTSTNANTVSIDQGIGTVGTSGSRSVSPTVTTTYTITATNGSGTVTDTATVTVGNRPVISSFSASPTSITEGNNSRLSWNINNATSAVIDNGVGGVSSSSGSTYVYPTVTTTYTLTASNSSGSITDSVTVSVSNMPSVSLNANPSSISEGSSSTLSWTSTNADTVSIDQGIGAVSTNGSRSISPTVTTTYTITATNGSGSANDTATVTVGNQPVINSFSASPTSITEGGSSTLSWNISGATSAVIDHNVGDVSASSGSRSVSPTVTTTYMLTASNSSGSITDSVTVSVGNTPSVSLSANPSSISEGSSSTLTWTSTNATTVSIDQGIGTVSTSGSRSVSPTVTTTYTITATNGSGSANDTATVTVGNQPVINSFGASPTSIVEGGSSTLSWNISGATSAVIDHNVGDVSSSSGSRSVSPTVTTTYVLTASNSSGSVTDSITVSVGNVPTVSLTADPSNINEGSSTILTWNTTNATSAYINQGIGSVSLNGSRSVSPTVTTTYTITASNNSGDVSDSVTVSVSGKPVINTFSANPSVINDDEDSMLSWNVSDADSISIDHGVGDVGSTGSTYVQPTANTTYILTASNASGTTTSSVTVSVNNLPVVTISANPGEITEGSTAILNWTSTYANSLTINQGIGSVGSSGSRSVQPTVTTTYTITASNNYGSRTASTTITVNELPDVDISASDTDIIEEQSTTLSWTTSKADEVSIDQNIGSVGSSGSRDVTPSVTTTYTITATNENGTVTDSVTIIVRNLPTVTVSADPLRIDEGSNTTLTWTSTKATSVNISPIVGGVDLNGSEVVNLTDETTFTVRASNENGYREATVTIEVDHPPTITSFTISPNNIAQGNSATLSWSTTGATSASIDQEVGDVSTSGSRSVSPSATTTYTLTAENSHGATTQSVSITVRPLPTVSIESDPEAINSGSSAKLSWSSNNATSLSIDQGIGSVAQSGSTTVTPDVTTTYTITATNANGSNTDSITVAVNQLPDVSISLSDNPIIVGNPTTLTWSTDYADSIIITPDIGIGPDQLNGSMSLSPAETTTYMITATNTFGSVAESVTLTVYQIPTVELTIDPPSIIKGQSATISWTSQHADTAEIDHEIGVVGVSGSATITPEVDTTYTITVTGPGGIGSDTETIIVYTLPTATFSADPENIISGDTTTLSWTTENAHTVIISFEGEDHEVELTGSMDVTPTIPTVYTLVASGQGGEILMELLVGVVPREAAYIPRYQGSTYYIDVMDLEINEVTYTLEDIGHRPFGVIADPDADYLYVSCLDDATVNKIDSFTGEVVAEIAIDSPPRDMVITPDGSTLYVSTHTPGFEGTVYVVDTAMEQVVTNIGLPRLLEPSAMDITSDGSTVYVCDTHMSGDPEAYNITSINTSNNSDQDIVIDGNKPIDIAVSGSSAYVITSDGGILRVSSDSYTGPYYPDSNKLFNKVWISNGKLYIASLDTRYYNANITVVSTGNLNSVERTIQLTQPYNFVDIKGMCMHPTSQRLYVVGDDSYGYGVPDIFIVNVGSGSVETLTTGRHKELWGEFIVVRP